MHKLVFWFFIIYVFIIINNLYFPLKSHKTYWSNFCDGSNRQRIIGSCEAVPIYFRGAFGQKEVKPIFFSYVASLNDENQGWENAVLLV